jgi:hypothetical protein
VNKVLQHAALRWLVAALLILQGTAGGAPRAEAETAPGYEKSSDGSLASELPDRGLFLEANVSRERARFLAADGFKALPASGPRASVALTRNGPLGGDVALPSLLVFAHFQPRAPPAGV